MCEETTRDGGSSADQGEQLKQRKRDQSPRRRSLSPAPYPGAKPITPGLYIEPHHLAGKLYRAHHTIQIPVYFIKWILGQMLAIYSLFFWHVPRSDDELINVIESTSLIIVVNRDFEAEEAEKAAFASRPGCKTKGLTCLTETRHYYIDVRRCELDLLIRDPGTTYQSAQGKSTLLKSWSMRYSKTRRREGMGGGVPGYQKDGEGSKAGRWQSTIHSFEVNGVNFYEREKMFALLFQYHTAGTHTKSHTMGNALADRILLDDRVRDKLSESTWTTTALHYGLLYGTSGPMSDPRSEDNQWMGLGTIPTRDSLVAECHNMDMLGPNHADKARWAGLDLPFADYLINARLVLTRVMKKNDIPPDMHEGIFLSCIMHATDHVLLHRVMWGMYFNPDPHGIPGTWYDHYESTCWRYMWVEPTLNPIWNNKIWRSRKPFYRQLYQGLKEIDTFNVADCITASIMY